MSPSAVTRLRPVLFVVLATVATAPLADDTTDLAQSLIKLRGEVESLNSDLELAREEQRTTLQGLTQQKAELEANLKRQEIAARELREKLAKLSGESADIGAAGDTLKPLLVSATERLRGYVAAALPFRTDERLAAIDEVRVQIESGSLPVYRAANRVWSLFEDEFRVTRETGQYKQTVLLGTERVLADVAKVGALMLFFKAQDGRIGYARRQADGWQWVLIEDPADRERVAVLFDSLGKQIRQGYFELPNVVAMGG
jgi:hypothetical protein